MDIFVL